MLQRSTIEEIISGFRARELPSLTDRDLALPYLPFHATAVVGVRRAGKTFRTYQAIAEHVRSGLDPAAVCRVQFNDDRLALLNADSLHTVNEAFFSLYPQQVHSSTVLFILDEIQHVEGWERYVLSLLDNQRNRVLLTGSTSHLLRGAFASALRGKVLAQTLHCYSLREFVRHLAVAEDTVSSDGRALVVNAWRRYLDQGAFPGLMGLDQMFHAETLQSYWSTMLLRDIIEAHPAERISFDLLSSLARHLASRIACPTSVTRIAADLRVAGHGAALSTAYRLVRYMEEAFMIHLVECHSPSRRIRDRNYKKAYLADWGLARAVSPGGSTSPSRMFENAVFIELIRRRYDVAYLTTRRGGEVDFVASTNGSPRVVLQACMDLTPENRTRELSPLPDAARYLGLTEAWVVTDSQREDVMLDGVAVHVVPAWEWMLTR